MQKHKYKRFWLRKEFMEHHAKNIKTIDQAVYMALSFFVNRERKTFVGYRKIGECLGMDKNTVMKAVNNLIAYGLVRRLGKLGNGRASVLQLTTVLFGEPEPSEPVRLKELKKELLKEDERFLKNNKIESVSEIISNGGNAWEEARKRWGSKKQNDSEDEQNVTNVTL